MSPATAINLKVAGVVIGTLGVYTWVANSIPQIESSVPEELSFSADVSPEELVAAGEEIFLGAGGCAACHGLGQRAPNLRTDEAGAGPIGARCDDRVPGEDCKTYLYRSLTEPTAYLVGEYGPIMPSVARTLSAAQIWSLVAYLQDQGGSVTVSAADLDVGEGAVSAGNSPTAPTAAAPATTSTEPLEVMRGNQCFLCHTLEGEGVELGPPFDDVGARLSTEEIRRSILDPAADAAEGYEALLGAMPPNFGELLTAGQLETVVQFLAEQR